MVMGTVSAANADINDSVDDGVNQEVLTVNNPVEADNGIVSADESENTFTDLNNIISNASKNSTVELTQNYTFNNESDSDFAGGINISKNIVIDGKGFTLNGNSLCRIFNIYDCDVIIKNVTFINANRNAICINNDAGSLEVSDSVFINNYGSYGACINSVDGFGYVLIKKSVFINNTGSSYAGGVCLRNGVIDECEFYNNTANEGGALIIHSSGAIVSNSIFDGNSAKTAGVIYHLSKDCKYINCTFTNNYATGNAGVIWFRGDSQSNKIINCTFTNNTAKNGGVIMDSRDNYGTGASQIIIDCTFDNNVADASGDVLWATAEGITIINSTFVNVNNSTNTIYSTQSLCLDNADGLNESDIALPEGKVFLKNDDFYISPNGTGNGTSIDDCANWAYAYDNIASAKTIYLTPGTYYDIVNESITKQINIIGDNAIIDLNKSGYAFHVNVANAIISGITFMNAYSITTNGGCINWNGINGVLSDCTFINNTGDKFNDVYYNTNLNLTNNTFYGSYIKVSPYIVPDYEYMFLTPTPDNQPMTANVYLNDELYCETIIEANSSNINKVNLSNLTLNSTYSINVLFNTNTSNKYYNIVNASFKLVETAIIYVSPEGNGRKDGYDPENAAKPDIILSKPAGSTIILLNGTFTGIHDYKLDFGPLNITGSGDTIIDAQNENRIFTVSSDNVHINNINVVNTYFAGSGGAIYWTGNGGILSNSTFTNTSASNYGGAVRWTGANGTLINSTFINSTAVASGDSSGGAVRWEGVNGRLYDSTFINCSSNQFSGAIGLYNSAIISNCNFIDCKLSSGNDAWSGGAIYIASKNGILIEYCNFTNCSSNRPGGAIFSRGGNFNVTDSIFRDCKANYGGAIYLRQNGNENYDVGIYRCSFDNCTARNGGAIVALGNNSLINDCNFTNCYASDGYGGAIRLGSENSTISNCNFDDCFSKQMGGAVQLYNRPNSKLLYCNFTNCNVTGNYGGAIQISNVNSTVAYCNFIYCYANSTQGGAIYTAGADTSISYCNFTDCFTVLNYGGAMYINSVNVTVSNSNFNNCHANQHGGAIRILKSNSLIDSCNFTDCYTTSTEAGAIRIEAANTTILNSNFVNCHSNEYGGAIRITNVDNVSIINSNFDNNYATAGNGASIYMQSTNSNIINSNFNNSNATYGTVRVQGANTTIYNSTFTNIVGGRGSTLYYGGSGGNVSNNVFVNCTSTSHIIEFEKEGNLQYNAFISSAKIKPDNINIEYNWYGNNTPDLTSIQGKDSNYLEVTLNKVYDPLVCGEWNGVLNVQFIKNGTDESVDVAWARPVIYDVTSNNANVKGEYTNVYGRLYTTNVDETVIVKAKIDYQESNEVVFGTTSNTGFTELKNLIKGTRANETLVLNNNYTYNPDDGELINGIVIDKPIVIALNDSAISGNNSAKNIFNITCDNVVLENMTLRDVDGTAIISTGNNTKINNLEAENIKDTVINIIAHNADISNVKVSGEPNTVVNIKGNNPTVKNITSDTYESNLILIDGTGDEGSLNITLNDVVYPDKVQANISAAVDGPYILTVNDKNYTLNITDGKGTIELDLLDNGNYEAVIKSSISTFNVTAATQFNVYNNTIEVMNVTVDNVTYPDEAVAIVSASVDGLYIVTVNNKTYDVNVINGTGSVTLDVLLADNYTVDAVSNIHNYDIISNTTSFNVKGMDTNFTLEANELVENKITYIPIDLPNDATGNVSVIVNGEVVDTKELINGSAILEIPAMEAGEECDVAVDYSGDGRYGGFNQSFIATVKVDGDFNMTMPEIYENETTKVPVTLPEDAAGNVSVIIDGEVVDTKEVVNGSVILEIPGLTKENYNITISYTGDDKYASQNEQFNVSVLDNIFISTNDLTKYYSSPDKFAVNVTDCNGNPLANKKVLITLNGIIYRRTTDDNGSAYMNINLGQGVYEAVVNVDNVTLNKNITILSTINGTDIVKIFRNGTQYYVTVKDANGNYLPEGGMVEFLINGVFYQRQVKGSEGLVKLNINLHEGEYIVTATNLETKEATSNVIKVLKNIINEDIVKYFKNDTQYCVTLLDDNGNHVGAGVNVTFNINGVLYTRQTNSDGVAKLNINLLEGDYIVTADYNGCLVSNNIKVLPVLITEDLIKQQNTSEQFVATLLDGNGQPYKNQEITFNINGVLYKKDTDINGQAKLNINLPYGKYIITSSYNGCNVGNTILVTY